MRSSNPKMLNAQSFLSVAIAGTTGSVPSSGTYIWVPRNRAYHVAIRSLVQAFSTRAKLAAVDSSSLNKSTKRNGRIRTPE
jgi:hypothetical protein